jgi:hypothetical protein
MTRLGTGGDDHLLRLDQLIADLDLPDLASGIPLRPTKAPCPLSRVTLFFLNRPLMPLVSCLTMPSLRPTIFGHINGRRTDRNTLLGKAVPASSKMRGVQQRFRRDATDVQTGPAKTRFALGIGIGIRFTTGDIETELCGSNGGNIATWTTTDNENVKLLGHDKFPF